MNNGVQTIFRDLVLLLVVFFVYLFGVVLQFMNPPGKDATASMEPPGSVIVELRWPDGKPTADVDMWVQAPGDVPVGYSNKGGVIFNLLRDDLGSYADPMDLNYENAFSRGIPPGEYTVNVHLFRKGSAPIPIPVEVQVSVKDARGTVHNLIHTQRKLEREGQELTVLRFRLTETGELVAGSVHDTPRAIRSLKKS